MRLGTRGSALALWQANWVSEMLRRRHPGLDVEIVVIKTTGDLTALQNVPLAEVAGKGVFVREIESALLRGEIDVAVHSAKDLQSSDPQGLTLCAFCERADPRDALVSPHGKLQDLPQGATVATGSPRRVAQLRHHRPDLRFTDIRGNVDTRLAKLERGEADALVLAVAGLARLGKAKAITEEINPEICLPQIGQGCVAVQCRQGDADIYALVAEACDHPATRREVSAEREFLALLGGGCNAPVAGYAISSENNLHLFALVASPDGLQVLKSHVVVALTDTRGLARAAYDDLIRRGAGEIFTAAVP
ncbi:MAG: hydroxymethylbilane synthase [Cytophagales bacterium]|nr:hydroxymethylbilane synthase [Armatimonadota bacterium]